MEAGVSATVCLAGPLERENKIEAPLQVLQGHPFLLKEHNNGR